MDKVIADVHELVTDSIWLGIANHLIACIALNCPGDATALRRANRLIESQDETFIQYLHGRYKNDPKIKRKDSLKKSLGLQRPSARGLDI